MTDPRQRGEIAALARDEVGECPPGEVPRRHAAADVPAGPRQTRFRIESDPAMPVAWQSERAAPAMSDPRVANCWEHLDQCVAQHRVDPPIAIELGLDRAGVVIRS